jgi:hypothetical protein
MKSGRSVSLDLKIWAAIEAFRRKNDVPDISSAVEILLEKRLKDLGELK